MQKAESGHPGLPLGMAPTAYVLWTKFMRHNPKNPKWFNRDRFLFHAGHGSMLIYSLLHLTGYDLSMNELKNFRQLHSKTPGHPENILTPGVEITTGPLGQGFANGVGMGIAAKHLAAKFNQNGFPIVDHFIYCICSDGDLMEGVSYESASLAGHLQLDNLIYFYDDNHITIEGETTLAFTEDATERFEAAGWHVQMVEDGNDIKAIEKAIKTAQKVKGKPKLIRVKTIIGFGMPRRGNAESALGRARRRSRQGNKTQSRLGPENKEFLRSERSVEPFPRSRSNTARSRKKIGTRSSKNTRKRTPISEKICRTRARTNCPTVGKNICRNLTTSKSKATRAYSGEVINAIAEHVPQLLGGSADLAPSNNTKIKASGSFEPNNYDARNMHYGIREHSMGSEMNGMALYGSVIPYGGTFQTFSDYMRPAIRLAALSHIQVLFVFTHDSIGLGEDGPTHQSVEHLAALRAIPNLNVIRPCDAHETREAWRAALESDTTPTAFSLSRQKVAVIDRKKFADAQRLAQRRIRFSRSRRQKRRDSRTEIDNNCDRLGSRSGNGSQRKIKRERHTDARRLDAVLGIFRRAIRQIQRIRSAFKHQSASGNRSRSFARLGTNTSDSKATRLAVDKFGASAPAEDVFRDYGFTVENVVKMAKKLV